METGKPLTSHSDSWHVCSKFVFSTRDIYSACPSIPLCSPLPPYVSSTLPQTHCQCLPWLVCPFALKHKLRQGRNFLNYPLCYSVFYCYYKIADDPCSIFKSVYLAYSSGDLRVWYLAFPLVRTPPQMVSYIGKPHSAQRYYRILFKGQGGTSTILSSQLPLKVPTTC